MFVTLVAETAKSKGVPEAEIWEVIMSQWWNRVSSDYYWAYVRAHLQRAIHSQFDNMSEPWHRKLTAMGISRLVSTGKPEVLDRFAFEVTNIWLDVLCEIKEQDIQREDTR